jgi:hypothetical protein
MIASMDEAETATGSPIRQKQMHATKKSVIHDPLPFTHPIT